MRHLSRALLSDLAAWLGGISGPPGAMDYGLSNRIRGMTDPRARLGAYVAAPVLLAWERSLEPWFSGRWAFEPDFLPDPRTRVWDLRGPGGPRAALRFHNRSVASGDGERHPQRGTWELRIRAAADLEAVVEAVIVRLPDP